MKCKSMKATAALLILSVGMASVPAQAVMISTEEAATTLSETALSAESSAKARLEALLARQDVQAGLAQHGVSPEAAAARVAALSDAEAEQLARQFEQTPAGGGVLGVIVFVFLVLLVTDILGFTKIFPFTKPIR